MLEQIKMKKNRDAMLHILRNPYGWSEDTVRDVRGKAAEELERLWALEEVALRASRTLSDAIGGEV